MLYTYGINFKKIGDGGWNACCTPIWNDSKVIHFMRVYIHRSPYGFDSICWGHFVAFYCEIFMKVHAQVCAFMVVLFFLLY